MKTLPVRELDAREDRPASMLLHDSEDVRVVCFHLSPGQEVKPHRSASTVLVQVIDGHGDFSGREGERHLAAGEAAVYEREELHGIRAREMPLRFLALITPGPR